MQHVSMLEESGGQCDPPSGIPSPSSPHQGDTGAAQAKLIILRVQIPEHYTSLKITISYHLQAQL